METKAEKKPDIEKQVANLSFIVRKMKNKLETQLGMDIDGDGKIGSGPAKKIIGLVFVCGMAVSLMAGPANTNIAVWYPSTGDPETYIDQAGGLHAPRMTVEDFEVTDEVIVTGDMDIGGTLGVTGVATFLDSIAVSTNINGSYKIPETNLATGVQTSLGKADTALQPITQVSGVSTSGLVATVTYQSSIAGVQHLTGWLSEAAGGVAVGTNCSSMVGADSTTVLAGGGDTIAYAVWSSKADGLSTLTVTTKALQTGLYFNTVQSDGVVVSTPAFDVAP